MEIWICFAPYETSCIHVYGIIGRHISEIAHGQKRRHIGIVHQELTSESVHLIGVDLPEFWVVIYGIFFQCLLNFRSQCETLFSQFGIVVYICQDLCSLAQ